MAIFRVNKDTNYTIMKNTHFKEKEMSLKAKGLLSLMLSLPDDWDYSISGLVGLSKDQVSSVTSALKELEKFNYLKIVQYRDLNGRFESYYDVFEEPYAKNRYGKTDTENQLQLNTKELNTNNQNYNNKKENIKRKTIIDYDWINEKEEIK